MSAVPARCAALAVTAALLAACGGGASDDASTHERIQREGVLRIAYADEPPYGYRDASGEVTGEAPEIARVVAERLGISELEGTLVDFGDLIPGLKAGRYDVIAAGMYITPERAENIDFSMPTYVIGEGFLVREGNPLDLHSYEDVRENPEARLGVVAGTVEQGYAREVGVPDAQVKVYSDNSAAVAAVRSGQADAFAGTSLTIEDILRKIPDGSGVEKAEPFDDPVIDGVTVKGYGAFGFRPGDDELRAAFDRVLADFLGSEEHRELVRPFGFVGGMIPPDGLTAQDVIDLKTGGEAGGA